jgi:hypothetical protein
MPIDMQIALRIDRQIDQAMASDLIKHVVKKTNAGVQLGFACAVKVDGGGDLGFFGIAGNACLADDGAHGLIVAELEAWLGFPRQFQP